MSQRILRVALTDLPLLSVRRTASTKLVYSVGASPPANCSGAAIATASPFVHAGLTAGTTYSYRLCATDNALNTNSGAVATATAGATTPSRLKGDLNGNGTVSVLDASMILQFVVGSTPLDASQQCAGDFNNNGAVSALDAALILQCVVDPAKCGSGTCP